MGRRLFRQLQSPPIGTKHRCKRKAARDWDRSVCDSIGGRTQCEREHVAITGAVKIATYRTPGIRLAVRQYCRAPFCQRSSESRTAARGDLDPAVLSTEETL